jgi:hypothetical protein
MPKKSVTKRRSAKNTLRLPDLDHSKNSVLQSLGSVASKRTYALAIISCSVCREVVKLRRGQMELRG